MSPWFILLALIAEILGTIGGFGSSLFFVPLAGFFFEFHLVLGITALFHLASNISKIALFRHGLNRKLIFNIGIPAIIFVAVGAVLSKYVKVDLLGLILGIFLTLTSIVLWFVRRIQIKPSLGKCIGGGAFSGLAAGLLGTGGAIRGLTLSMFNLEKDIFIATSAVIDLGIDFTRSIVYFFNGYMDNIGLYIVPVLLVVGLAGTYIGKKILAHISQVQFKSIVLLLILVTGLITLYQYASTSI